jgi:hypothetical protein
MMRKPHLSRVTATTLAQVHGVSRRTVYYWHAWGMPRCGDGLFRVEDTIGWRTRHTGRDGRVHRVERVLPEAALDLDEATIADELAKLSDE